MIVGLWLPLTVAFVGAHATFRAMITRAKWRYLGRLQGRIDGLLDDPELIDKDKLAILERLIDHHDEVRDSPNSTIDFRAWLSYFNSLLLPFVAGLLANIEHITTWLRVAAGVELRHGGPAAEL